MEENLQSLVFLLSVELLTHKTPHQLLQETGNWCMHVIFLHCWHTVVITTPSSSHVPSPVSSSSLGSSEERALTIQTLLSLYFLTQFFSIFHHHLNGVQCLSHLLSEFITAAWDFGYLRLFSPTVALILHSSG